MTTENPTCDFDCWTQTGKARNWLHTHNATELRRAYGFIFFEHPHLGDTAPVLAIRSGSSPASEVFNTQDFDLPTSDPLKKW